MEETTGGTPEEILVIEHEEQPAIGVRQRVHRDDLPATVGQALPVVVAALRRTGAAPAGPPYARYRGSMGGTVDVEVGFPVIDPVPLEKLRQEDAPAGTFVADPLPAARAAETVHVGGYEAISQTYERLAAWLGRHGLQPLDESWELYESGPSSDPDPATWRTRLVMPVSGPELSGP